MFFHHEILWVVNFYSIFLWFWQRIIFFPPFFDSLWDVNLDISFLFFPFYSYFTVFYGDGSHHFNRLLLGLFFNKVRDFGEGGFGFLVGQES